MQPQSPSKELTRRVEPMEERVVGRSRAEGVIVDWPQWRKFLRRVYVPLSCLLVVWLLGNWLTRPATAPEVKVEEPAQTQSARPRGLAAHCGQTQSEAALGPSLRRTNLEADANHVQLLYMGNSQTLAIMDAQPGDMTSPQCLQMLLARQADPLGKRIDVRLGSYGGMNVPEMFLRLVAAGESRPRQVDIAILAVSLEQFRKLGVREEVATLARAPAVAAKLKELAGPNLPNARKALDPFFSSSQSATASRRDETSPSPAIRFEQPIPPIWRFWRCTLFSATALQGAKPLYTCRSIQNSTRSCASLPK